MSGQIVLIAGSTGSGKTTAVQTFARRATEPYLMFGMDMLVGTLFPAKYTGWGEKKLEGFNDFHEDPSNPGNSVRSAYLGEMGWTAMRAMHEMIAAAARSGQNMVVDHHMFIDPPILQDCIWRLKGVPVLFANLKPPREVLEARLLNREYVLPAPIKEVLGPDAAKVIAETLRKALPFYYQAAYENDCYDLTIDSAKFTPDEICEQIERRLEQGPGTAFDELRRRYPRPVN